MAVKKQWIQSATVAVDEDTAQLQVGLAGGITVKRARIDCSSSDNIIVNAVLGKKICVLGLVLVAAADTDVQLFSGHSGDGTALTGAMMLAAKTPFVVPAPADPAMHWLETGVGELLCIGQSGAVQLSGCVLYYEA